MRILFTGGGTAGHVNPAIAIAEAIRARDEGDEILFVGREGGGENRLIENAGFKHLCVPIKGFERKLGIESLKSTALAIKATARGVRIIKDFKPDVIVGTGGFASWPAMSAGILKGIPTVIHESNAYPGLVTRLLHKKCKLVLLNLEGTEKYLSYKRNLRTVGNPIRADFSRINRAQARRSLGLDEKDFLIVSFGGSIGSQKMNDSIIGMMKSYSVRSRRVKHIHSTGVRYYENAIKREAELCKGKSGCKILPYIDNMPTVLRAADLAISRCGAVTLSELSCVGVSSILIPSPNVADGHQHKNAEYLAERGAAVVIDEKSLNERTLLDAVRRLECNPKEREEMSSAIGRLFKKGCAENIVKLIDGLLKSSR